jgi:hypothetical protein
MDREIACRKTSPIAPPAETLAKGMAHIHHPGTGHGLNAPHGPCPSFEMLMLSLDALLLHRGRELVCLWDDCFQDRGIE